MTTFANTSDIETVKPFIKLIDNIDSFYADKAYKREDEKNKHKIRAKVEHRFAHIKTHMK